MQQGTCKFCHQVVMVDLPADSTEEERNNAARHNCGCDKAERARMVERGIQSSTAYVKDVLGESYEDCAEAICHLLKHWPDTAKSLTMVVDQGETLKVTADRDGIFEVKYKSTVERKYKAV